MLQPGITGKPFLLPILGICLARGAYARLSILQRKQADSPTPKSGPYQMLLAAAVNGCQRNDGQWMRLSTLVTASEALLLPPLGVRTVRGTAHMDIEAG